MNTYAIISQQRALQLIAALTDWYNINKRELPWRRSREPYPIWICEIMAQQTRIASVLPYYERFIKRFPTVRTLAEADISDVLKAWEGLGYYSRAHNLHQAARMIVHEYEGIIPSDEKELKKLPGIGDYTAGAILSISFDQPVPAVDGNVLRVFARLENNRMDVSSTQTKKALADTLKKIIPVQQPGIFTQALMELGALICVPKNPLCESCPVSVFCHAFQLGLQAQLPIKAPKKPLKHLDKTLLILSDPGGRIQMRRRQERLLHGMWMFYAVDQKMDESAVRDHLLSLDLHCGACEDMGEHSHTFTHLVWNMRGFLCHIEETRTLEGYSLVDRHELENLAIPSAVSYYANQLRLPPFGSTT